MEKHRKEKVCVMDTASGKKKAQARLLAQAGQGKRRVLEMT